MTLFGCTKVSLDKVCDTNDPLADLSWLKTIVEFAGVNSQDISITKVIFKDADTKKIRKKLEGFVVRTGSLFSYYDCSGNKICEAGGAAGTICDRYEIVKEEKLL